MRNITEKLITRSFKRLLDKGIHRGFITYEELARSLGKRHYSKENIEKAFFYIFDNKIVLVQKKSDYRSAKKRSYHKQMSAKMKVWIKAMIQSECIYEKWVVLSFFLEKVKLRLQKG